MDVHFFLHLMKVYLHFANPPVHTTLFPKQLPYPKVNFVIK
jgi:hypothetical protein